MDDTSSCVRLSTSEMSDDFPRVPMMMGVEAVNDEDVVVTFLRDGLTPVTRWMSEAKSEAARCTPGQSSLERRMGAAFPLCTTANVLFEDLNATQLSCPRPKTLCARRSPAPRARAGPRERYRNMVSGEEQVKLRGRHSRLYAAYLKVGDIPSVTVASC